MTNPAFNYKDQLARMNQELTSAGASTPGQFNYADQSRALVNDLDSAIAGTEYAAFNKHRMELFDAMFGQAFQSMPDPWANVLGAGSSTAPIAVARGSTMQKPSAQQIGQAHAWNIPNPENLDAAELQHLIQQRRDGVPRAHETSLRSALFANEAMAVSAAAGVASMVGNAANSVGWALEQIPFFGHIQKQIVDREEAKLWFAKLDTRAAEAIEQASAEQPRHDLKTFQFMTGAGKMAGYLIPAMGVWKGLGMIAAIPRLSWLAEAGTPLMRLAVKGGLTSAILEDPDTPTDQKIINIGFGAAMGGLSMWGRGAMAAGGGAIGAGIGAGVGSTPEEQRRNALEYGVAGAALGFLAPTFANGFAKVRKSFPTMWERGFEPKLSEADLMNPAIPAQRGAGTPETVDAEWSFANEQPQLSGNPPPSTPRLPSGELGTPIQPAGPGAEPTTQEISALIRGAPTRRMAPDGSVVVGSPEGPAIPMGRANAYPRVAGYLETPFDPNAEPVMDFGIAANRYDRARLAATESPESALHSVVMGYDTYAADDAFVRQTAGMMDAARFSARTFMSKSQAGFLPVTDGPAHLQGSLVSDSQGRPLRVYHGTGAAFDEFDPTRDSGSNLYQRGLYHTESSEVASTPGYTKTYALAEYEERVNSARLGLQMAQRQLEAETDPEAISTLQDWIQHWQTTLVEETARHPDVLPNVRPAFLDIRNPYNVDKIYSLGEAHELVGKLQEASPDYEWQDTFDALTADNYPSGINGDALYKRLETVESKEFNPDRATLSWKNTDYIDRLDVNSALSSVGFDGITHIGGTRQGNYDTLHRVWIAFRPEQVHPYFKGQPLDLTNAAQTAHAISKQATIMASEALPETLGKVEITEGDVVDAVKRGNPGGTSIVRGVGKPVDLLAEHPDVRFVQHPNGQIDALVGDFTDQQISDYQKHGTYIGNIVVTKGGTEGEVINVKNGLAILRRTAGGPPLKARLENIQPTTRGATAVYDGSVTWEKVKTGLLEYVNREAARAGMAPAQDIWDPRAQHMMQSYLQELYPDMEPGVAHALDQAMNSAFIEEARALDPEARDFQAAMGDLATGETNAHEGSDEPYPVSLEETSASKGFVWLTNIGRDGGTLRDTLNPEGANEFPIETDEAAEEFLRNLDRPAPDLTPASDVPFEVMEDIPVDTEREPRIGVEEESDHLAEEVYANDDEIAGMGLESFEGKPGFTRNATTGRVEYDPAAHLDYISGLPTAGAGGGGYVPPEPPLGVASGAPGQLPPGRRQTVGGQFDQLRRDHPEKYAALLRRWTGQQFHYTRYLMENLQNSLQDAGLDKAKTWEHYEALEAGRAVADNEGFDWTKEFADIMRQFPNKLHRSGFVARTHEIQSEPEKFRRYWKLQEQGYSDKKIKKMIEGDARLDEFFDRMFRSGVADPAIDFHPYRYIKNYVPWVRQRQAQGPQFDDPYNGERILPPGFEFFAEHARGNNMQFRVMDMRQLGQHYIRAMMFKKYQAVPYENLVRTWQDPRIPKPIRDIMLDHAEAMRYGYRPEPGIVVKAIQGLAEHVFRTPISSNEAARIAFGPLGWMYRRMMGGKSSIFMRDATQPMMAASKVKMPFLTGVYRDVLGYWRSGDGRESLMADYQLALRHGWVTRDRPPMEALSVFESQPGADMELLALSPEQQARRERAVDVMDKLLPEWLRRTDDKLNTMKYYGKLQQLNQFIPGMAAYRQAKASIGEFRALQTRAALENNLSLAMPYEELERMALFNSFGRPQRAKLQELIDQGTDAGDEAAAGLFAREVVKWSQGVYTTREKPKILRQGFGRAAGFLGSFSFQFAEGANNAAQNGIREASKGAIAPFARALMVIGGTSWFFNWLGDKLGMRNLKSWAWSSSLRYVGSPLLQRGAQALEAVTGINAAIDNRYVSPEQKAAVQDMPGLLPSLNDFNIYGGYLETAANIGNAAQGTTPGADITRYLMTGDRGSGISALLDSRRRAEEFYKQYYFRPPDAARPTGQPQVIPQGSMSSNGTGSETTRLAPAQERDFQRWVKKWGITDVDRPGSFYDYRGAYLAGVGSQISPVDNQPHWPDTFKQHGHPTFSVESRYSRGPGDGGSWQGETFIPARDGVRAYSPADSSTPGITRYNQQGAVVYNSTRVGPDGRVPTHRIGAPTNKQPNETWEAYEDRVLSRDPRTFPRTAYNQISSPTELIPEARTAITAMLQEAQRAGVPLQIAETYRPIERQEMLFQKGRSQRGPISTWTLTSDHAERRAADLIPVGNYERGVQWIQDNAARFGLQTLGAKDPGHVAMPAPGHPGAGGQQ